jgi:hypothetical protein
MTSSGWNINKPLFIERTIVRRKTKSRNVNPLIIVPELVVTVLMSSTPCCANDWTNRQHSPSSNITAVKLRDRAAATRKHHSNHKLCLLSTGFNKTLASYIDSLKVANCRRDSALSFLLILANILSRCEKFFLVYQYSMFNEYRLINI